MESQTEPLLALRCAVCHRLASEQELKRQSDTKDPTEEEGLDRERRDMTDSDSPEQLWLSGETELVVVERRPCETPSLPEFDVEEFKRKLEVKEQQLEMWTSHNQRIKESLMDVIERKKVLAEAQGRVLLARRRVELVKQAYDSSKSVLHQEYQQLKSLEKSNALREHRLKRVRQKNFMRKEAELSAELAKIRSETSRKMTELEGTRGVFVREMSRRVFPIEVESLSERDDGEDYETAGEIDCDASLDVDEGWVLSGIHRYSSPSMRIVTASLPSNGDYSSYIKRASERRRAYSQAAQQGKGDVSSSAVPSLIGEGGPCEDPFFSTPAALLYTAQLVELLANVLDQPLPYPLSRKNAISVYGRSGQRRREFLDSVAKLDDNILYLCFSQNVPLSALTPGHTLQNLLGLVTHSYLGRTGAFECHPELTRYRNKGGALSTLQLSHDLDDNEPPNISYTSDQLTHSDHDDLDDDMESIDDEDSDEEEWGDPTNYPTAREDSEREMDSLVEIEKFETEWEHLEPSEQETKLFEEERMKQQLVFGSTHDHTHPPSSSSVHQAMAEREIRRDRLRHLDYESTYMDFAASVASSSTLPGDRSVQLNATDCVRLVGSIDDTNRKVGVASSPMGGIHGDVGGMSKEAPPTEENQGFFGTLSSLWTSTFGGRAN